MHHFSVDQSFTQTERFTEFSRFRRLLAKVNTTAIEQLDYRRERQVYLLTDGKRSIAQIASLLGISPVEVAHMTKRLFELGYVEYIPFQEEPDM
jgi:transposase-like protein